MNHEFQVHRVLTQWLCNLCKDTFHTQEAFRRHIGNVDLHYFESFESSQIEEIIRSSKRLVTRDASTEQCPFCLTALARTQKAFASHVGKHQQEISLAALPNLEADWDDETNDDHSDHRNEDADNNADPFADSNEEMALSDSSTVSNAGTPNISRKPNQYEGQDKATKTKTDEVCCTLDFYNIRIFANSLL
jgi:uncharacterized C2H2 Zn-finger protein